MARMSYTSVDARMRLLVLVCIGTRLGYENVIVYFGVRDSKEGCTMQLVLFVLGRTTQKKT